MKQIMRNPNFQTDSQNSALIRNDCPKTNLNMLFSIYGLKFFAIMPKKRSGKLLI